VENPLCITVMSFNGTRVVAVAGELDIATAHELARELRRLEHCNVTVDLASTTFIDSSGLRCIVDAHQRIEGHGNALTVRGASSIVRRTFEITGLDQMLLVEDSQH
jgi:anti-sigma B factor antagonist